MRAPEPCGTLAKHLQRYVTYVLNPGVGRLRRAEAGSGGRAMGGQGGPPFFQQHADALNLSDPLYKRRSTTGIITLQPCETISHPRVSSSDRVKVIMIKSQKKPAKIAMRVKPVEYFTCMKKSTTRSILTTAIASAATVFHRPRSI